MVQFLLNDKAIRSTLKRVADQLLVKVKVAVGKDPSEERKQDKAVRVKKREAEVLDESGLPGSWPL